MNKANQNEPGCRLDQVWVRMSMERQAGVIQMMAQLALKWMLVQIENGQEEVGDEQDQG